ncbi:MAG: hypothetical protein DI536_26675 [Archangium gephyra]|uniref:Porin n=1 Tax=Archangium gephyra TaxID=48 RepID=A0A2W5T606_9BACT|nr:MAG: hypothetical protein DI536_26675 [Archangium gephyra]
MNRLGILLAALVGTQVSAAELTRVASSFEEKDPFGMFLDFTYQFTRERGTISREWYQLGQLQDVTELNYLKVENRLGIDLHLGIYKDLELHVGVPIIFGQDRTWSFAGGTDANNSTINRNCTLDPQGTQCADPGRGMGQLFNVDPRFNSYRAGLGDFTFGLAWNPFVQKKDPSKPTWTLRFDYTAPTAALLNPAQSTSSTSRGAIGDKVHRYTFSTHVSKRLNQYIEPYVGIWYTLPWKGPGFYSNCDVAYAEGPNSETARATLSHPENCGRDGWTREDTGVRPVHTGGANFGTEITVFEREERFQKVAFDFRGWFNYVSEGRTYNELSDPMRKLLYSSDYGQLGGQFGIIGSAAEFIKLRAYTSIAYNTEHFLTNEDIGKDLNGNGVVDVSSAPEEINPNFDYRVDRVGRRFRIEQQFIFSFMLNASFNF